MYDEVDAYEIAFGYRDVPREVEVLLTWCERHSPRSPTRALELAAGPGAHSLELARRGLAVTALDANASMCQRVIEYATKALLQVDVVHGDMRCFDIDGGDFDLVLFMLNSAGHLLTLDALVETLATTARHVHPGGLFFIEFSHPADFFTTESRSSSRWERSQNGVTVRAQWGTDADDLDPLTQVRETTVRLETHLAGGRAVVHESVLSERLWTATEVEAAVRLSQSWSVAGRYGDLAEGVPLSNAAESWRMIFALQRLG